MKNLRFIIILFSLISCRSASVDQENIKDNKTSSNDFSTEHFNITISSDLSNRLNQTYYPRTVSDVEIVSIIVDNIYPRILMHKRSMNQRDQFKIDFINKQQISAYDANSELLNIDFSKFKTQSERIKYLRNSYQNDKKKIVNEFGRIYELAANKSFGSDIWTYLQQGVDSFTVIRDVDYSKIRSASFKNRYRNILILLTDGYIETRFKNPGYELTAKKIKEFRNQYLKSGEKSIEAFFKKNQQYKINNLSNPLLKDLEILVLELYDRTDTIDGASVHPTDLEIMKVIWTNWLKNSGVKRVSLNPKSSNKAEAEKLIMKFIGI